MEITSKIWNFAFCKLEAVGKRWICFYLRALLVEHSIGTNIIIMLAYLNYKSISSDAKCCFENCSCVLVSVIIVHVCGELQVSKYSPGDQYMQ